MIKKLLELLGFTKKVGKYEQKCRQIIKNEGAIYRAYNRIKREKPHLTSEEIYEVVLYQYERDQ